MALNHARAIANAECLASCMADNMEHNLARAYLDLRAEVERLNVEISRILRIARDTLPNTSVAYLRSLTSIGVGPYWDSLIALMEACEKHEAALAACEEGAESEQSPRHPTYGTLDQLLAVIKADTTDGCSLRLGLLGALAWFAESYGKERASREEEVK